LSHTSVLYVVTAVVFNRKQWHADDDDVVSYLTTMVVDDISALLKHTLTVSVNEKIISG